MRNIGFTVLLLGLSNIFMTVAWYAHLKELNQRPWIVAALVSWGIAFFEYMLQVPGNRIGYTVLSIGQLKLPASPVIRGILASCARSPLNSVECERA